MTEYVQIYDNATGAPKVKCLRDVNDTPAANQVRYAGIAVPRTSLTEEVLQTKNTIHVSTFFYSGPGNPLVSVVKQGFSNAKLLGVIPNDPLHYVTPSEVADAVKVAIATNYDPATKQISFVDAAGNIIPVFAGGLVHNTAGANGGASSGAGTTTSPLTIRIATNSVTGIAYATRATNIPTDMNRDDSDISPAAVKKMLQFVKPVASASGLNAEQLSADAIEVPMLSNFSCNAGTRGAPRFTVPVAGGGSCAIDLGNLPYYSEDNPPQGGCCGTPPTHAPGTVLIANMCSDGTGGGAASAVVAAKGMYTNNSRYRIDQIDSHMPATSMTGLPYFGGLAASSAACSNSYTMNLVVDSEGRLRAHIRTTGNDTGGSCYPLACMSVTYLGEDA